VHAVKGTSEDEKIVAFQLSEARVKFTGEDEPSRFIDYK
jgi:hypothetical protein